MRPPCPQETLVGFELCAWATSGDQQVGVGGGHALLWRGTAASMVDLHPRGFVSSMATAVFGGQQVGMGELPPGPTGTSMPSYGAGARPAWWTFTQADLSPL
jgi:hypothetical protein